MTALSPQLRLVADLVAEGFENGEIATRMGLALVTVEGYVKDVYRRTGTHNRVQFILNRRRQQGPRPWSLCGGAPTSLGS